MDRMNVQEPTASQDEVRDGSVEDLIEKLRLELRHIDSVTEELTEKLAWVLLPEQHVDEVEKVMLSESDSTELRLTLESVIRRTNARAVALQVLSRRIMI